jgi:AraC-like DNA-binding protein
VPDTSPLHAYARKNHRNRPPGERYRNRAKEVTSETLSPHPHTAIGATPVRTSSAAWVRGVVAMFEAEGLDGAALLRDSGLDASRLATPEARFPADEISVLWQLAVERSGKATLGLSRELAARYGNMDAVGHAMSCSPTLVHGLQRAAHYLALVSDAATVDLQAEPRGQWLSLGSIGSRRPVPRQRVEYGMLTLLMLCRWLTRRELQPLALEFVFAPPADTSPYREAFGVLPRFNAPANRLLLAHADLLEAIPTQHADLAALHERLLEEQLARLGQDSIGRRACAEIARRLPQGEPRRQDVAASLGLADRTLQRRLQAEGHSYLTLLDQTRRELAQHHLSDRRHSLAEVADLLGFVDNSNFFRACKRWFGLPPAQLRARMMQDGEPEGALKP